ncbi:TolB family protein [Streptomyces lavendulae]|uniref:TolB family protein n=1 Tax=Streptomyces lavendulae TaxID=1914 RepID=UPI0024A4B522|nr:hypothetical protein [Streptomyces lavendulae]GLX23539.1 hypothetical protein Slala01_71830 [Streptomyces lavendulae subsp. lavendulae]
MRGNTGRVTTRRVRAAVSAAAAVCAVTAALPGAAAAEPAGAAGGAEAGVERISVAPDGSQGDGGSTAASITPDGRHVVFASAARNLTPDGAASGSAVFVRDRQAAQTKRMGAYTPLDPPAISGDGAYVGYSLQWFNDVRIRQYQVRTGGTASADCSAYSCNQPSLNADGRYTALALLIRKPSPANRQRVEVHDWNTGAKVTVASFEHTYPARPSISGDGRYVAYQDGGAKDVFVWDRTTGTSSGPVEGPSTAATLLQLSDDGSTVVYLSGTDTYVHDLRTGTSRPVPNVRGVAVDPTGRHLLYAPNDPGGPSLVLRDLETGTDQVVSDRPATAGTDAVSTGGREVVFQSAADDIVPGDTNGTSDVFVRRLF